MACCWYLYIYIYIYIANFSEIRIIDPYIFETKYNIKDNYHMVRSLIWNENDTYLIAGCSNGLANGFQTHFEQYAVDPTQKMEEPSKLALNKLEVSIGKNKMFNGLCFDEQYNLLVGADNDGYLRIYQSYGSKDYYVKKCDNMEITSVALSKKHKVLLLGTSRGTIRMYLWPILNISEPQFYDFYIHSGKIKGMRFSGDHTTLFTCSDDGALMVLKVTNLTDALQGGEMKKKTGLLKIKQHLSMNSLCLVFADTIETKKEQIRILDEKIKKNEDEAREKETQREREFNKEKKDLQELVYIYILY